MGSIMGKHENIKIYPTELVRLINKNNTQFRLKDNEIAHDIINELIKKLIERLNNLEKELITQQKEIEERFNRLEQFVTQELVSKNGLQYRPPNRKEYISLGATLTDLYERLNSLENNCL